MSDLLSIPSSALPKHIAVILDGNGRWAREHKLSRREGHQAGSKALENLLDTLLKLQIPYVSLYVFSTENWRRPLSEIKHLFRLLAQYMDSNLKVLIENNMRMLVSGDIEGLPRPTRKIVMQGMEATANNTGLAVNFCLNYGSRAEMARAFQALLKERVEKYGTASKEFLKRPTEKDLQRHLYTAELPDVDLLIRTAGEQRLSNFLLFQCAYAEMYFSQVNWPDFDDNELGNALREYASRTRKFGALV